MPRLGSGASSQGRREDLAVRANTSPSGAISVRARKHVMTIDEKQRYGGHDRGANPVEHMLAGLASASLVVLRLLRHEEIAARASLTVTGRLNVDRVAGTTTEPVFEYVTLTWVVDDPRHGELLRGLLPAIAARRPGQALIDAAGSSSEEVTIPHYSEAVDNHGGGVGDE